MTTACPNPSEVGGPMIGRAVFFLGALLAVASSPFVPRGGVPARAFFCE